MILPVRRETIIIPKDAEGIKARLKNNTGTGQKSESPKKMFMGSVRGNKIQISLNIKRPENFIPQINGNFEKTSTGCILFLKYTLIFSSRMFVIFWSLTSLFFALFLWFMNSKPLLWGGALGALVLNVAVTHINFQRQYQRSRKALHDIIFEEKE